MKYIVKCRFCGRSYVVDSEVTGADFMCEACAGVNNIRDVEERVQEKKKKIDPDIANIQSFDKSKSLQNLSSINFTGKIDKTAKLLNNNKKILPKVSFAEKFKYYKLFIRK